jgi:flagellar export protein FliJ
VLDFRREQVERIQLTVAQQEKCCVDLRQQLAQYQSDIQQALVDQQSLQQQSWQTTAGTIFDPSQGQYFSQFLWRLKQQCFIVQNEITKQDERLAQLREALRIAVMRQKSLEILRDKAQREFNQHIEKLESDFLDELSQSRLLRQRQQQQPRKHSG